MVVPCERGGYLAVSAPGEPIRLGVMAPDEESARTAFASSARRWLELVAAAKIRDGND